MRGKIKNNKGFSLVELIIVIAVMAILAGALAPALIRYIQKSRMGALEQDAKTIYDAANLALGDFYIENIEIVNGEARLGLEDGANQFLDMETGQIVGRVTTWTIGRVVANPDDPNLGMSDVETEFSKLLTSTIGASNRWSMVNPSGHAADYNDGKYYVQITYTLEGVSTVEICRNKYYTIFDGTEFQTSRYSSDNPVKFHNVVPH